MFIIYLFLFGCCVTALDACRLNTLKEIQNISKRLNLTHLGTLTTPDLNGDINCIQHAIEIFSQGLSSVDSKDKHLIRITSNLNSLKSSDKVTESNCSSTDHGLDEFLDAFNRFVAWQISTSCPKKRRRHLRSLRRDNLLRDHA